MLKLMYVFYDNSLVLLPPTLPIAIGTSPEGEGAPTKPFPHGGNKKEDPSDNNIQY
jgi:hypothetical protein